MRQRSIITAAGVAILLALTGCAGDSDVTSSAPSSAQDSASVSAAPDGSGDPSGGDNPTDARESASEGAESPSAGQSTETASAESSDSAAPSPDGSASTGADAGGLPDSDTTPGAKVLPPEKKGQTLTLADFFNPDSRWKENRYSVADQQDVSGVAAEVRTCGESSYDQQSLELRLANNFEKLTFSVGQSNESKNSDQNLVVRVLGNGKQLDVRRVPFNQIEKFSLDVKNVNAVIISPYLDSEVKDCGGSVQAVIYGVELQ